MRLIGLSIYINGSSLAPVGNSVDLLRHHGHLRIVKNVARAAVQDFRNVIRDCRRTTHTLATRDNFTKRPIFVFLHFFFFLFFLFGRTHT